MEFASIDLVSLVALFERWDLARNADQNFGNMRLEQVVEPGCARALLEDYEQTAAQSSEELQKRRSHGFQDGFPHNFALAIPHRYLP